MAKFFLTVFALLAASQVLPSSGSCVPSSHGGLSHGSGHGSVGYGSGAYAGYGYGSGYGSGHGSGYGAGPLYIPGGAGYGSGQLYVPGHASDCSVPPVYIPPPTFPNLPTIHAPKPLTIPLQVPSVIPVGKVCVCKAIQIQPSVVPVPKPVYTCGCGKDVIIPGPGLGHGAGHNVVHGASH